MDPHLTNTFFKRRQTCEQSLEMQSMHSFAAAAAFTEKQRKGGGGEKKAEYGHKAYLYTTCIYVETWIFNISTQLTLGCPEKCRETESLHECVCVCDPLRWQIIGGAFLTGPGPDSTSEVKRISAGSLFRKPTPPP